MEEYLFDYDDPVRGVDCDQCNGWISVDMHIICKDEDSYVWLEGMCDKCGKGAFIPLPETAILFDDTLRRAIAN